MINKGFIQKGQVDAPHDIEVIAEKARHVLQFEGGSVQVHFPHEKPYPCQIEMMQKVTECITKGQNGLFESPTGTGKTLSLLCAAVGTLRALRLQSKHQNEVLTLKLPSRIIYCTRTHSQINQIFDEIKTHLPYKLRISPFASRKHSCIYENLTEQFPGNSLNLACKLLRKLGTIQQKMNRETTLKVVKKIGGQSSDIEDSVTVIRSGCPFYYGYTFDKQVQLSKSINLVASKLPPEAPLSVTDFVKLGQIHNTCPYYLMRARLDTTDLAIIPYNYLIDKNLRDQFELKLKDAIILFDEGHNIESFCEDLYTFELSVHDLFQTFQSLNSLCLELSAEEATCSSDIQRYAVKGQRLDIKAVSIFVLKMIDVLESYNMEREENRVEVKNMPKNVKVFRLPELFALVAMVFGKLKDEKDFLMERMRRKNRDVIGEESGGMVSENREYSFVEKVELFIAIMEKSQVESPQNSRQLSKLHDTLLKIKVAYLHYQTQKSSLPTSEPSNSQSGQITTPYFDFYVCLSDEFIGTMQRRKLSLWCFNPSFAFKSLLDEQPHSVLFASGTLSPLNTYAAELGADFPIKLENDHVIDKNSHQVMIGILTRDIDEKQLSFTFDKRGDSDFYVSFARTLGRIIAKVPYGGILVFVPSYGVLKKIQKVWKANKLFKELAREGGGEIFIEYQEQERNEYYLGEFKRRISEDRGKAVFIAVCRGKLSEGIDFTDNAARLVVIAGIPYPQIFDPKVVTKKDYLDRKHAHGKSSLNGNAWYKLQACRAVNQAIGRVIRHISDFGAILLLDERFHTHNFDISKWLNTRKKVYQHFPDLETDLKRFYQINGCSKTESDDVSFQTARQRASNVTGTFCMQKIKKDSIKIQYEYDIPMNELRQEDGSTVVVSDRSVLSKDEKKGNFSIESLEGFQSFMGVQKQRAFGKRKLPPGVMDDYDEGEPFVESLEFSAKTERVEKKEVQNVTKSQYNTGGYKRKAYSMAKKQ